MGHVSMTTISVEVMPMGGRGREGVCAEVKGVCVYVYVCDSKFEGDTYVQ